ncbi:MAG: thiolase domain-containing protein [Candidatus Diapherotrites archaeon]|jgi:acetyl-CoA C-acetyltransferase|uniref:Thiolase domain-containing protein n=1 Tax=Candidatus Iainarchaeum sp. TaxID=3101447 RepID=A0A8T5GG52_9ARCH|nr:thiolase domain-containing protein [Candidatus Diapherotrites archaeon]MBT7241131.1 thiolase domain-containing protein [Candidatus Diapherotrites archaeon]
MNVGVLGIGITKFGERWDQGLRELLLDAQVKSIKDANIEAKDIDALYTGNMGGGALSGQLHIGAMATENLNINKPSSRVEGACASGSLALRAGILAIESGEADIVQVNGVEKMTDVSTEQVTTMLMGAGDEELEGFNGLTFPGLYALLANAYMSKYPKLTRDLLAEVSVKNHFHGARNDYCQFRKEINIDVVKNATMVADPLTLFDCSPITDGAASIILASEAKAKELGSKVSIIGSGMGTDSLSLARRNTLTAIPAGKIAADAAYASAGIKASEVNFAEVHDCFTIAEIMAVEALGFAKEGEGYKLYKNKDTYFDGKIPINTSGGLKACGHPVGATGVKQAVEATMQLRGEAKGRQVKDAEIGVTHNVGGSGASAAVHVFKRVK